MKIRLGFVSNSSSSSFVVSKHFISGYQLDQIRNAAEWGKRLGIDYSECAADWTITENEAEVEGDTWMDNFDFREFLVKIGVPEQHIHYTHDG